MRAPYNVLVLPYCKNQNKFLFCIFKRVDSNIWQFVAGGGEIGETAILSAKRESYEEANIPQDNKYLQLESMCYVSVDNFSKKARENWGKKYVIPVYTFAVQVDIENIRISHEHTDFRWCEYEEAKNLLHFDLDKTALYELNEILNNG